ncbi:MAG: serine/threonine protein kinase, partial [Kiritimatiellaeota bacterium]|nr:serine/threonine protein kinase [Kiritimatiellota bacterium]
MYTDTIEQKGFRLIEQMETTLQMDVWKAQQVTLDRIVCLQILRPEFAQSQPDRDRFLAMARCVAKLKSESIASVFDIVSDGDFHYVVMEYVDGPTLEETVAGTKPLPLKQILQIASSLAFALEQLWDSAHIVHRNLKGATVRLDPRGVAKITDFSLAFISKPGLDMVALDGGHIVGSPSFISPEYAQGKTALTTQTDMYSFGALLYTLATGYVPFNALDAVDILESQVHSQIPPPHELNRQLPVEFSWFIHRLMMKNPMNRHADWRAVRYDIKCISNGMEPRCVRPDEDYLSTIIVQPMLDAMAAAEEAGEAGEDEQPEANATDTRKAIRLKQKARHSAQWEEEHNRDILLGKIRTAVFMSLLLLAWFALLFWYRGMSRLC